MQADVILKEPPPWMPPSASQGGTRRGGRGGAAPPSYAPDYIDFLILQKMGFNIETLQKPKRLLIL